MQSENTGMEGKLGAMTLRFRPVKSMYYPFFYNAVGCLPRLENANPGFQEMVKVADAELYALFEVLDANPQLVEQIANARKTCGLEPFPSDPRSI